MIPQADIIVFDMDGVLVDVSDSYRETIVQAVKLFTGQTISRDLIQEYKNRGGFNNDWILTRQICEDLGVPVRYESVVESFNDLFLNQGLIHRERWLPRPGLLDTLAARSELAIFTGRSTLEANITLQREGVRDRFLLVTSSDVEREKPAPDGLLKIMGMRPGKSLVYLGDAVDDARASKAAGVPFIGVTGPEMPMRETVIATLHAQGAIQVIGSVNELA